MTDERARWRATPEGLRFGGSLAISFQRYLIDDAPPLPAIPRSLGALHPAELSRDRFLLALHPGEAIWLALEFGEDAPPVAISASGGSGRGAWHFGTPKPGTTETIAGALEGRSGGCRFAADAPNFSAIAITAGMGARGKAVIELVEPQAFERRTGRRPPRPARREDGYGGWRLP